MFYKLILTALLMASANAWATPIDIERYLADFKKIEKTEQMPELLVFASFSLPEGSLKQLATQVRRAEGVLVFRGMIDGSMKKTITLLHALSKHGVPAIIHPKLFEAHKVTRVPTFVLKDTDRMVGNMPLAYVLRSFATDGDNKKLAEVYLKKMEDSK